MAKTATRSLIAILALAGSAFAAQSLEEAFKEASYGGEIRAKQISKDYDDAGFVDAEGFAAGGNVGFETAPLGGISLGARFYTAQEMGLSDSDKMPGTYLVDGNEGYTLLGQAYVLYQGGKTTLKIGRQQFDTPLAGSDDIRIIPNLFEAYTLINTDLADTTLVVSHVAKMSGWDSLSGDITKFKPMSEAAGVGMIAPNEGVSVGGIQYSGIKDLALSAWYYHAHEVLDALYIDGAYTLKASDDLSFELAAQYYAQKDSGKVEDSLNSLGKEIDYGIWGAKVRVASSPLGLGFTLAVNGGIDTDRSVTTFGVWGGYPEYAVADEFWMNSFSATGATLDSSYKLALDYDFGKIGAEGLGVTLSYVGFEANEKNSDVAVIDLVALYKVSAVKGLALGATLENINADKSKEDANLVKISASYSF